MSVFLHNIRKWCELRRWEIFVISRAVCAGTLLFVIVALVWEMLRPGLVVSYVSPAAMIIVAVASGAVMTWSSDGGHEKRVSFLWRYGLQVFFAIILAWVLYRFVGAWQGIILAAGFVVVFLCAEMIE